VAAANRGMLGSGDTTARLDGEGVRRATVGARGGGGHDGLERRPRKTGLTAAALPGAGGRHDRWLGCPARRGMELRPIYRRRASLLATSGQMERLGEPRGQTTAVGPRVTTRRYGDAKCEASSACARSWGRSGLGGRVLERRARGPRQRRGAGAGATWRDATCRTGDV
jgi:hypothetical protein